MSKIFTKQVAEDEVLSQAEPLPLDRAVDWHFDGKPITYRDCIRDQCGPVALSYAERIQELALAAPQAGDELPPTEAQERAAFESWAVSTHGKFTLSDPDAGSMWSAWKARAALAERGVQAKPSIVQQWVKEERAGGYCELGRDRCDCGDDLPTVREDCSRWRRG
jgi:hypothetical protein